MNLPQLRQDLANHAVYGTAIYFIGRFISKEVGLIAVIVTALVKDIIHDKIMKKGTFDPLDIIATITPAVALYLQDVYVSS